MPNVARSPVGRSSNRNNQTRCVGLGRNIWRGPETIVRVLFLCSDAFQLPNIRVQGLSAKDDIGSAGEEHPAVI